MTNKQSSFIEELEKVIQKRSNSADIDKSYTQELLASGKDRIAKKVIEESGELAVAFINDHENKDEIVWEAADLIYHMLVLLHYADVTIEDVSRELEKRHKSD